MRNLSAKAKPTFSTKQFLWALCLLILWSTVIFMFIRSNGKLGLDELLSYQPESKALSVLAMLLLFLLKSVDFLIHSAVLYALSGIMYKLPFALFLNLIGICIMSAVPYFIGCSLGTNAVEMIREKYPKLRTSDNMTGLGGFTFALLLRCLGVPIIIVGLYLGAKKTAFRPYLTASVLGLSIGMVPYTIIGDYALALGFSSAVPLVITVHLLTIVIAVLLRKYFKVSQSGTNA